MTAARFHNALRILLSLDGYDLINAGVADQNWGTAEASERDQMGAFLEDPAREALRMPDANFAQLSALLESRQPEAGPDHACDTVDALTQAESFISGFEDDETQEGIADILAGIRAAIQRERARPDLLAAVRLAWAEIQAWRRGLNHRNMNKCKVGATFVEERTVRTAIASAEGQANG
ncbi:hypothetical protein [Mesorhizobium sp. M7A.F.Ca.MR.148.00.0.0]|uniref:hypothetical protein n=1 Tax=Mesorhizobium sp. M7A.F.Ca.MR.148.00.0.0 TaxID=2496775 RepID=UPI000FCCA9DA|nr:hypothetical protein [Mesorhizobium sp. M7A.F.Ca.MR.148.00.0.0]RUV37443.1 hypothetical protein EOB49_11835 [Mesorhizobium sp. M7A.F.Ca.MR.148.00.0.0]